MNYMGSKNRIANDILPIILYGRKPEQYYVEPFVGGCNMIDKVRGKRMGNDANVYLIEMWKALQRGERFATGITREHYHACLASLKNKDGKFSDAEIGWVGFMSSFRGRFFQGYCENNATRTPIDEHIRCIMRQLPKVLDVEFHSGDYSELDIPQNAIVYCDPPYASTQAYAKVDAFDYDKFYDWCREKTIGGGYRVFISEYSMPNDFVCVWRKCVQNALGNGDSKSAIERLFVHESIAEDILREQREQCLFLI